MDTSPEREPRTEPRTETGPAADTPLRQPQVVEEPFAPVGRKADLTKRFVAGVIDAVAAVLVGMIPVLGGIVATAYWLTRDGLDIEFMPNRSLGKKLVGLKPVRLDGHPVDIETSIRRNWPFAVGGVVSLLAFIPIIGWLLMIPVALLAIGLVLLEAFFVVTDDEGRRFGDKFADTVVVETGDGFM